MSELVRKSSLLAQWQRICPQCRRCKRCRFYLSWARRIPWRRKWQPTPGLLPGKLHRQRRLVGYSPWGHKESGTTERLSKHINQSWICSERKKVMSFSHVWLFETPWAVACLALPTMGFSRQEYLNGLPFPSPGVFPFPGIEPGSATPQADCLLSEPPGKPKAESCPILCNWLCGL